VPWYAKALAVAVAGYCRAVLPEWLQGAPTLAELGTGALKLEDELNDEQQD
jgi:hypothetical protein